MIKINLGCGKRDFGNDWIHIDGGGYEHLDSADIFNLPYENNTIDLIYASHVIEYFNRKEVLSIIEKWKLKLKIGGVLRIAVPDFYQMSKLYIEKKYPLNNFLGPLYGQMLMDNEVIYHRTTYDFVSLKNILEKAGFSNIRKWDWRKTEHAKFDDHSQAHLPHMDKENGILISLNVECTK